MEGWPYSEIDLVLKQVGVPWSASWDADVKSYLMHYLGEADDAALVALGEYFGGDGGGAESLAEGSRVWAGDFFRLFLSHSSSDKVFVSELKTALRSFGIEGFVAHEDIEPTAEWMQSILGALDTCDALAAVLTDDFRTSNWCDQEVGHCIGMRKLVLPLARGCMPYGFMGPYQALKCGNALPGNLGRDVADILIGHPLSSARMAEALVANLERSSSFAQAKVNMALVGRIQAWTPELLRRLEGTLRNSQVDGSFGVREAIQSVVRSSTSPVVDDVDIPF